MDEPPAAHWRCCRVEASWCMMAGLSPRCFDPPNASHTALIVSLGGAQRKARHCAKNQVDISRSTCSLSSRSSRHKEQWDQWRTAAPKAAAAAASAAAAEINSKSSQSNCSSSSKHLSTHTKLTIVSVQYYCAVIVTIASDY